MDHREGFHAFPFRLNEVTALAKASAAGQTFEKKLGTLEKIVARLEGGEASLEESLKLFEEGTALLKELSGMLDEAERKVETLTRDASGKLRVEPFEEESEG